MPGPIWVSTTVASESIQRVIELTIASASPLPLVRIVIYDDKFFLLRVEPFFLSNGHMTNKQVSQHSSSYFNPGELMDEEQLAEEAPEPDVEACCSGTVIHARAVALVTVVAHRASLAFCFTYYPLAINTIINH